MPYSNVTHTLSEFLRALMLFSQQVMAKEFAPPTFSDDVTNTTCCEEVYKFSSFDGTDTYNVQNELEIVEPECHVPIRVERDELPPLHIPGSTILIMLILLEKVRQLMAARSSSKK